MRRATLFLALAFAVGCTTVPPGHRAVQVYFGDLSDDVLMPGFYTSVLTTIKPISVQVQATEGVASATTHDLQNVTTQVLLNWSRDPQAVHTQFELYPELERRILSPAIQESVKSVTAQFSATDLVQKRQQVKDRIEELITSRLEPIGIVVDTMNITDFQFSKEFNVAIEAKVKAEQEALRAGEELETIKIEAQQAIAKAEGQKQSSVLAAEGEAQSIEIQGEALRLNPQVLELRRIERWNGIMPTTLITDGGSPLVQITPAGG